MNKLFILLQNNLNKSCMEVESEELNKLQYVTCKSFVENGTKGKYRPVQRL